MDGWNALEYCNLIHYVNFLPLDESQKLADVASYENLVNNAGDIIEAVGGISTSNHAKATKMLHILQHERGNEFHAADPGMVATRLARLAEQVYLAELWFG